MQLAERDLERGNLEPENSKRIATAVKEVMENLGDFEPRRWFRRAPVEKPDEHAQTGLSSLTAMDQEKEEVLPNARLVVSYLGENSAPVMKGLKARVEADAYAVSLAEATDLIMAAARRPEPDTEPEAIPEPERPALDLSLDVAPRTARKSRATARIGTKLPAAR